MTETWSVSGDERWDISDAMGFSMFSYVSRQELFNSVCKYEGERESSLKLSRKKIKLKKKNNNFKGNNNKKIKKEKSVIGFCFSHKIHNL